MLMRLFDLQLKFKTQKMRSSTLKTFNHIDCERPVLRINKQYGNCRKVIRRCQSTQRQQKNRLLICQIWKFFALTQTTFAVNSIFTHTLIFNKTQFGLVVGSLRFVSYIYGVKENMCEMCIRDPKFTNFNCRQKKKIIKSSWG